MQSSVDGGGIDGGGVVGGGELGGGVMPGGSQPPLWHVQSSPGRIVVQLSVGGGATGDPSR